MKFMSSLSVSNDLPILKYLYYCLIFLLILIYYSAATNLSWLAKDNQTWLVMSSNSMTPILKRGDLILSESQTQYAVDEIVTLQRDPLLKPVNGLVTHRIKAVQLIGETRTYLTKGDANEVSDGWISAQQVLGKMIKVVPKLGYLSLALQTSWGKFFIIWLPVSLIAAFELNKIKASLRA